MAITERQLDVARITLAAAGRRYGAALAGGNALNIHEELIGDSRGIARSTQDVDVFVLRQRNVRRAVDAVTAALERAGYAVDRSSKASGLAALGFEDADDELARLVVTYPGDSPGHSEPVQVEIAHFYYEAAVSSPIGPVLSLNDLGGWKTVAWAARRAPRDPCDVASFITAGYEPSGLIRLAKARDKGLEDADFAEAAVWVDASPDELFAPYLENQGSRDGEVRNTAWLRQTLARWPREPVHAG
jgi:hypothetical protein